MAQENANPLLKWALEYHRRGWCIISIPHGKKAARIKWGRYQKTRPDEKQIRKWFAKGKRNIAVVLGPVSGDLASRDFDTDGGYHSWAEAYPGLAERLPTVKTARGYHVYFEAPVDGIKKVSNGELRGRGGYCMLPPSVHPDGPVYQWVNLPTTENLLCVDPELAGFTPSGTEQSEQTEQAQQIEQAEQSKARCGKKEDVDIDESIEQAIDATLPRKHGERNRKIFEFAQWLRADPRLVNAGASELKPIFNLWFEKALPHTRTKDFETSWFDFLYAWERVVFAKGVGMAQILERAKVAPIPQIAEKHQDPKMQLLICWCKELQLATGNSPFWLSARTVAKYLDISAMTAWRWLFILVREGVLEEIEKGKMTVSGGVATRYRYVGRD